MPFQEDVILPAAHAQKDFAYLVFDLDGPNVGFITISQQPMIDTVASLSAFTD
jgi:hypothetical protein